MTIEELRVLISAETSGLRREINNVRRQMSGLSRSVRNSTAGITRAFKMLKVAIIAIGIGKVIKDSIMSGMEAIESENLFEVSLGRMADSARKWSEELQKTLGLNGYEIRKNLGVLYNMTTSMGLTESSAYDLSTSLTKLAYDMASFYNLRPEEAFNKIRAGITGETEPLKALGILVDENTIKQVAYKNGIAAVGAELTQQQKVMARYLAIMEQTKNAQGDLARTIDSPANQLRILRTQLELLKINLGQAFMPIVQVVLPILTSLAKWLVTVTNLLKQFTHALFGISKTQTKQASTAVKAAKSQIQVGKAIEKAGEKAKGSIAGFDEINQLQEQTKQTGGKVGDISLGEPVEIKNTEISSEQLEDTNIGEKAKEFKTLFEPIIESFEKLKTSVEPLIGNISKGLKFFYSEILEPLGKWTISKAVPSFLDLLREAISLLNPVIEDLKPLGKWLWDKFLKPMGSFVADTFISTLDSITESLKKIGDWMTDNKKVVENITKAVAAFFLAWKVTELLAFIQMSGGVIKVLKSVKDAIVACTVAKIADKFETIALIALYAKDFIASLVKTTAKLVINAGAWLLNAAAVAVWNAVCEIGTIVTAAFEAALAMLTSPITLVIMAIVALVAGIVILIKHWDKVKKAAKICWDKIVKIWRKANNWFNENVIKPVEELFKKLWEQIAKQASETWNKIVKVWKIVHKWFDDNVIIPISNLFSSLREKISTAFSKAIESTKEKFEGLVSFITGIFTSNWRRAWEEVKKIFKGIVESLTGIFKSVINSIIDIFNTFIRYWNKIEFKVPSVRIPGLGKVGGFSVGVPKIAEIPKLARGGIIDRPTLAMIGERGKEAVVPLENTSFVNTLATAVGNAVLAAMQVSNFNSQSSSVVEGKEIVIQLDGTKLARIMLPKIDRELQRIGAKTIIQPV
ncbi:Phage-related protein [Caminicella sporogenes DSM 14501]|uniref:Phage-related protein n=1 Tax=Caminicella sporogenes DSM 14501 TaxID=1121266 RepID=A0A1M6MXK4_9FIRM|nr:hypothetical protein [Caminicella sporogenes]RKD22457.1 hypothetical protein BET04_05340 [Caminicella sporogenes]SHJ88142.1 Phage-related protein [Caminicella sporogenes DSM 14501]